LSKRIDKFLCKDETYISNIKIQIHDAVTKSEKRIIKSFVLNVGFIIGDAKGQKNMFLFNIKMKGGKYNG